MPLRNAVELLDIQAYSWSMKFHRLLMHNRPLAAFYQASSYGTLAPKRRHGPCGRRHQGIGKIGGEDEDVGEGVEGVGKAMGHEDEGADAWVARVGFGTLTKRHWVTEVLSMLPLSSGPRKILKLSLPK